VLYAGVGTVSKVWGIRWADSGPGLSDGVMFMFRCACRNFRKSIQESAFRKWALGRRQFVQLGNDGPQEGATES
jgi:hypothetical protein